MIPCNGSVDSLQANVAPTLNPINSTSSKCVLASNIFRLVYREEHQSQPHL